MLLTITVTLQVLVLINCFFVDLILKFIFYPKCRRTKFLMMKRIVMVVLLMFAHAVTAQDATELRNRLNGESKRQQIETYLDITEIGLPADSNLYYLDQALKLSKEINFDSIFPIEFASSINYYVKGDYRAAKSIIRRSLNSVGYSDYMIARVGHIHMLLGVFCEAENDNDSAFYYYDLAIGILRKDTAIKSLDILSSSYQNKANIYLKMGKHEAALPLYFQSLEVDRSRLNSNFDNIAIGNNNIAGCYQEMGQYDKALFYHDLAIQAAEKDGDLVQLGNVYVGLGRTYLLQGELEKAKEIFLRTESILENVGFVEHLNLAYVYLAQIYLSQLDYNLAELYSEKAMTGVASISDFYVQAEVYLTQAKINKKKGRLTESLKDATMAHEISKLHGYTNNQKEAVEEIIVICEELNNYKDQSNWYDTLIVLNEDVLNADYLTIIEETETKYQTERKEKQNTDLKLRNAIIQQDFETSERQFWMTAISLIGTLIILMVVRLRTKNNTLKMESDFQSLLLEQHERMEAGRNVERERIAEELHDGIANDIYAILLRLDHILGENEEASKYLDMLGQTGQKTRELAHELNEYSWSKDVTIEHLLKDLVDTFADENLKIDLSINGLSNLKLTTKAKVNIYRTVQEALVNITRHTKSTIVSLILEEKVGYLNLSILNNESFIGYNKEGVGLKNMKKRAKQLSGIFKIESKNGKTAVHVVLPMSKIIC
ncbi:MAG: tetratricopeptide repeat protein [Crocinitomix sp.]|nr:tetratricopeptide repeat protein [Crocinitomix sp.]